MDGPIDGQLDVVADGRLLRVGDEVVLGPIDTSAWNPIGVPRRHSSAPIKLAELLRHEVEDREDLLRQARRSSAVVCSGNESEDADLIAMVVAKLALSGCIVVGDVRADVAALLGDRVTELVSNGAFERRAELSYRERHSLSLRRAAFCEFGPAGRVRRLSAVARTWSETTPRVSVLLPSNRPDDLPFAISQIRRQRGVDVELVVGLHGREMTERFAGELSDEGPLDVVEVGLEDHLNLGDVMNELTAAATSPLVTKWDDDDWYDDWHVLDLVHALEYSGSGLVGKAAEFVYLEAIDLTIRRFRTGGETMSTTVAGGTLLGRRADVIDVGWASVPRQVDRRLIESMAARGLETYRTHGFGYVLRRRGAALGEHTWRVGDPYFLRQSVEQRPGLDLEFAGVSNG